MVKPKPEGIPNFVTQKGYYGDSHSLEQRRRWYDPVAIAYDRARPRYPAAILDRAIEWANLQPGDRLLEIGAGPGIVTLPLAQRGFEITAVEPSGAGCDIIRDRCGDYPKVEVVNQTFEEWPLEAEAFDAVVAATSFHWVSPVPGYDKVKAALKSQPDQPGHVILLWNVPPQPSEAVWRSLQPCFQRHAPQLQNYEDRDRQEAQLKGVGRQLLDQEGWIDLGFERIDCELTYTVEDYLSLLCSLSPYILLADTQRATLLAALAEVLHQQWGDSVETSFFSALQVFQLSAS